jgi:hypothetical protein
MAETKPRLDSIQEFGTSGLKFSGAGPSQLYEEWDKDLRGRNGATKYREMWDNNATVSAMIRAVMLLARGVDWRVDPGGETPEDEKAHFLIESSIDDYRRYVNVVARHDMRDIIYGSIRL